jgi:hypothetical protein
VTSQCMSNSAVVIYSAGGKNGESEGGADECKMAVETVRPCNLDGTVAR